MAGLARSVAAAILLLSMTTFGFAADKAIIILDASGSMWAQIDGKPQARNRPRDRCSTVLQSVPADDRTRLHGLWPSRKGQLRRHRADRPAAAGTASAISAAADSLKFLGKTPLTAAVKQAAEALKYTEDKATVILITDGLETCDADPCALGKELEASGVDFTADVVGFGLTAEEGKQVACLADNTGGKYIQAYDEKALQEALVETVVAPAPAPEPAPAPAPAPAPEPAKPEFNFMPDRVLAEGGDRRRATATPGKSTRPKSDGTRGDNVTTEYNDYKGNLEPGDYVVVAAMGEAKAEQQLKIEAGQVYKPVFMLNAGTLIIHPRPSEGPRSSDGAAVVIDYPGGDGPPPTTATTKIVLPAGDQKVTVKIGEGEVTETIPLAAGQTIEKDIIVGVGHVVANAYYTAGGDKVDASGIGFKVVKAKKKIDGSREEVTYAYGPDSKFDLPPGDYVLIATMDQAVVEQPFSRQGRANTRMLQRRHSNAGVLAITAPGASTASRCSRPRRTSRATASRSAMLTTEKHPDHAAGRRLCDRRRAWPRQCRHEGRHGDRQGRRTDGGDGAVASNWASRNEGGHGLPFCDVRCLKPCRRRSRHGRRGRPSAGTRRNSSRPKPNSLPIRSASAVRRSANSSGRHQHLQRAGLGVEPDDVAVVDPGRSAPPSTASGVTWIAAGTLPEAPDMRPSVTSATAGRGPAARRARWSACAVPACRWPSAPGSG